MTQKVFGILFFALISCATCLGQTSFQGLTPGTSIRTDVERALGMPVRTISTTQFEYKPPVGIAKVEVSYGTGAPLVERIRVYFLKPISRAALLQEFKLPPQADAKTMNAEGKLVEFFGGQALLVMTYVSLDEKSGVSRIAYCSRDLFKSALEQVADTGSGEIRRPLSGQWVGSYTDSQGGSGSSTITLTEESRGVITGVNSAGWKIENGQRNANELTWEYQVNGCRDYKVRMQLSADGTTLSGTYTVRDHCVGRSFTGRYVGLRK